MEQIKSRVGVVEVTMEPGRGRFVSESLHTHEYTHTHTQINIYTFKLIHKYTHMHTYT